MNDGLQLGNVTEEYSDEPKGSVISQSAGEGIQAAKGSTIDIVISKGPEPSNSNTNTNSGQSQGTNANEPSPAAE